MANEPSREVPSDEELLAFCAEVMGCHWKRGRKPHLWDYVIPGGVNKVDCVCDGGKPNWQPHDPWLTSLDAAVGVAMKSAMGWQLGIGAALAWAINRDKEGSALHDGTAPSMARALIVALERASR